MFGNFLIVVPRSSAVIQNIEPTEASIEPPAAESAATPTSPSAPETDENPLGQQSSHNAAGLCITRQPGALDSEISQEPAETAIDGTPGYETAPPDAACSLWNMFTCGRSRGLPTHSMNAPGTTYSPLGKQYTAHDELSAKPTLSAIREENVRRASATSEADLDGQVIDALTGGHEPVYRPCEQAR